MPGTNCVRCGNSLPENAKFCTSCGNVKPTTGSFGPPAPSPVSSAPLYQTTVAANVITPPTNASGSGVQELSNRYAKSAMRRYRDAYWTARFTVFIGELLKLIGVGSGLVLGIGLSQFFNTGPVSQRYGDLISGVSGFIVFLVFFVWGIKVCAQGQLLKAHLDSVVCGSPFMSIDEKAKAMSL